MTEFRRQQSRVWWSSFHADDILGSPIPAAGPSGQNHQDAEPAQSPASPQDSSRDSSSSPSTSHKSQDSGFSDSEGSGRTHASALSSSPEVSETGACGDSHEASCRASHLQKSLSGTRSGSSGGRSPTSPSPSDTARNSCSRPLPDHNRLSQDDSCIQTARPTTAVIYRRQKSADDRDARTALSQSVYIPRPFVDNPVDILNHTVPGAEFVHRSERSFVKNKKTQSPGRRSSRYVSRVSLEDSVSSAQHTTVVECKPGDRHPRTHPEGEESAPFTADLDKISSEEPSLDLTSGPGFPTHTSTPKTAPCILPKPQTPLEATPVTPGHRGHGVTARRILDKKAARPINLLSNFAKTSEVVASSPIPPPASTPAPVSTWLSELRWFCLPECSVALQSKALLGADLRAQRQLRQMHLNTPHGLHQLQARAQTLSREFARLSGRIKRGSTRECGPLAVNLSRLVLDFLQDYECGGVPTDRASRLRSACERLRHAAVKDPPNTGALASSLSGLRSALTSAVDSILEKHVQELVGVLEGPSSPIALREAVTAICALGSQGAALADVVVRCGGIRALLQVVLDSRTSHPRRSALRALAAICCTARAIRCLEQAGGVEVVAELLSESDRCEEELAEAAAVLAQITAPWVPENTRVEGLTHFLDPVIKALTRMVRSTASSEVLLLSSAALAHLSYVEADAVWPLMSHKAAGSVLKALRKQGPRCSVFLQEQAATLLSNMAAVPEARTELARERAVVALLCFLQIRPSPLQPSADISAAERVQHKAAIALSRLASDREVAQQVVSLEGVTRLVRLCRLERERNHSDGVLLACLAALRKIDANCEEALLSDEDRRELIQPRLLDSFMMFSSRQESYV